MNQQGLKQSGRSRVAFRCLLTIGLILPSGSLQAQLQQSSAVRAASMPAGRGAFEAPAVLDRLEFESMAKQYLDAHGLKEEGLKFPAMVNGEDYVRIDLGSFQMRLPLDACRDNTLAGRMQDAVHAMVNIQHYWYEWRGTAVPGAAQDWQTLSKWVESWSTRKMAKLHGGPDSILVQFGAKQQVLEAAERVLQWTAYTGETAKKLGERNLTILAPTRKHFHLLSAAAGLARPDLREKLWVDDVIRHGAAWVDFDQIIALENFMHPVQWENPFLGRPLDQDDKNGLKQFAADRISTVLLRKEYFRHGTHFFEEALAINLIIAYLGFNSNGPPEFDYKYTTAGGRTEPYSRFVPGGNPAGGTLPPRKAQAGPTVFTGSMGEIGSYRANQGSDYFVRPLKDGQKEGLKLAGKLKLLAGRDDKLRHFMLTSLESHGDAVVSAPFLGLAAEGKGLPDHDFLDDYEDFFRAYRSCFFHWLRTEAAGAESAVQFGKLIEAHARRKLGEPLDDVAQEIYGLPLSDKDLQADSLELRFIKWIKSAR